MTQLKWLLAAAVAAAAAPAGCNGNPRNVSARPPQAVSRVDELLLQVVPSPVNWDGHPGPDGLEIRVHLFQYSRELPVTVKGTLEFALYEGIIAAADLQNAKPFRTWQFSGDRLKECLRRSSFGWGYVMRLAWGTSVPTASSITLLPAYRPPQGKAVPARPISIPMQPR